MKGTVRFLTTSGLDALGKNLGKENPLRRRYVLAVDDNASLLSVLRMRSKNVGHTSDILWTLMTVLQHIHGIGPCPAALYRNGCVRAVVPGYTNEIERDATGEGSMSMSFANRSREKTHPELRRDQ